MTKWQTRVPAWVLLIALTSLLVLFPVQLRGQSGPIQAPYIFGNLSVFSLLFYFWIVVLALLAFTGGDEGANWEHLVLAGVVGAVFVGFWVFIVYPYGGYADDIYNVGHVRYIVDEGHFLAGHPLLAYFDYPGMHIMAATLSDITGLGIFETRTLFLMLNAVFFCMIIYAVFARWLKRSRLAFVAVLLMLMTGGAIVEKMHIFTPGAFSLTLLAVFLMIEGMTAESESTPRHALILTQLTVFMALTISYFATTLLVPLMLLGGYLVQRLAGRTKPSIALSSALLFLVVFLAWFIYGAWHTSHSLIGFLPHIEDSLRSGEFLSSMMTLSQANLGAQVPLWVNAIRFFWWGLLGAATIAALRGLLMVKRLSSTERLAIGGLLGVLALAVIGLIGTHEGVQLFRFLLYGPLFAMPLLVGFLARWGTWGRRAILALVVCVAVLSFPVFLCSVNTVATDAIYSYDAVSGAFLEAHPGEHGRQTAVYRVNTTAAACLYYYSPNVSFINTPESVYYVGDDEVFWQELHRLVIEYLSPDVRGDSQELFIVDEKTYDHTEHMLGISRDDGGWQELDSLLSTTDRIYSNGHVRMYTLQRMTSGG